MRANQPEFLKKEPVEGADKFSSAVSLVLTGSAYCRPGAVAQSKRANT